MRAPLLGAVPLVVAIALTGTVDVSIYASDQAPAHTPQVRFPSDPVPLSELSEFLSGNFKIIRDVRSFPTPVLKALIEAAGHRPVMANPGQKYQQIDVLIPSLPKNRLIFGGTYGTHCFIYFEQGGIAHFWIVEFLGLDGTDRVKPVWKAYCGYAKDLDELRSQVSDKSECHQSATGI